MRPQELGDHQAQPRNAEQEPQDTLAGSDPKPHLQLCIFPHLLGSGQHTQLGERNPQVLGAVAVLVFVLLEQLCPIPAPSRMLLLPFVCPALRER